MKPDFQLTSDEIRNHFNTSANHSLRLQVEQWEFEDVEALNCGLQMKEQEGWLVIEKRSKPVPFLKVARRGGETADYPDIKKACLPQQSEVTKET